jgi:hypothetical protein
VDYGIVWSGSDADSGVWSRVGQNGTSAKQDMKDAGHDTKAGAKDAGKGVKKGTKKSYKTSKKDTKKAYNKTKNTTKGAVNGGKAGGKEPQQPLVSGGRVQGTTRRASAR